MVHFVIMGVLGGSQQLMEQGVVGALNCLRIQWANQQGYRTVNFLGADPFLKGRLFQYKRKWGTAVSIPPYLHRQVWLQVRRNTPAVSYFLKENPCIVMDGDGRLHGLIFVDDPHTVSAETMEEWKKHYVTPGLSALLVRSVGSFAGDQAEPNVPDLIIPIQPVPISGDGQ